MVRSWFKKNFHILKSSKICGPIGLRLIPIWPKRICVPFQSPFQKAHTCWAADEDKQRLWPQAPGRHWRRRPLAWSLEVPIFGKTALFSSFCFCLWLKEMHSSKPSKKPPLLTPADPESAAFTSVVETTAHLGSFLHSGQTYQLLPAEVSGIKLNTDWPPNFTTEK